MKPLWVGWQKQERVWVPLCTGETWKETYALLEHVKRLDHGGLMVLRFGTHPTKGLTPPPLPRRPAWGGSMIYQLILDGFLPVSVNRLLRMHPTRRHGVVARDADLVAVLARQQGVPPATDKRRVSVRFEQPRGRVADPDNRMKALLDQLVMCRLLRDDGPAWCELGTVESVRGEVRRTVVTLEDVDEEAT